METAVDLVKEEQQAMPAQDTYDTTGSQKRARDLVLARRFLSQEATNRPTKTHQMHKVLLARARLDPRLAVPAERAGLIMGSACADWVGMSDEERTLRRDFVLIDNKTQRAEADRAVEMAIARETSEKLNGTQGLDVAALKRGRIEKGLQPGRSVAGKDAMGRTMKVATAMHQITRGYNIYVRANSTLCSNALADARVSNPSATEGYPRGGERLLLTMRDLEMAIEELLLGSTFGRRGTHPDQMMLTMGAHLPTLEHKLREKFYPVDARDLKWLFRVRTRSWLRLAATVEVDHADEALREIKKRHREEVRKTWMEARNKQTEAMDVVKTAQNLASLADTAKWNAERERIEAEEAEADQAKEAEEAEEARNALSKEMAEADQAKNAKLNDKARVFRAKILTARADQRAAIQRDLVTNAKREVELAAQREEEAGQLVGKLRVQVDEAKEQLHEVTHASRVVKLRVRKAQDKLSAVEKRVEEALESKRLAAEAYTAAGEMLKAETAEARRLEKIAITNLKLSRSQSGMQIFSAIIADKEISEAERAKAVFEKELLEAEEAGGAAGKERQEAVEAEQLAEQMAHQARGQQQKAIQAIIRVRQIDLEALHTANMATRIQAAYRGFQGRELVSKIKGVETRKQHTAAGQSAVVRTLSLQISAAKEKLLLVKRRKIITHGRTNKQAVGDCEQKLKKLKWKLRKEEEVFRKLLDSEAATSSQAEEAEAQEGREQDEWEREALNAGKPRQPSPPRSSAQPPPKSSQERFLEAQIAQIEAQPPADQRAKDTLLQSEGALQALMQSGRNFQLSLTREIGSNRYKRPLRPASYPSSARPRKNGTSAAAAGPPQASSRRANGGARTYRGSSTGGRRTGEVRKLVGGTFQLASSQHSTMGSGGGGGGGGGNGLMPPIGRAPRSQRRNQVVVGSTTPRAAIAGKRGGVNGLRIGGWGTTPHPQAPVPMPPHAPRGARAGSRGASRGRKPTAQVASARF